MSSIPPQPQTGAMAQIIDPNKEIGKLVGKPNGDFYKDGPDSALLYVLLLKADFTVHIIQVGLTETSDPDSASSIKEYLADVYRKGEWLFQNKTCCQTKNAALADTFYKMSRIAFHIPAFNRLVKMATSKP